MFFAGHSAGSPSSPRKPKSPLLEDVDHVLANKSEEDRGKLLRAMVSDLLNEVDLLRDRLDETEQDLSEARKQRDTLNNECMDQIQTLTKHVQGSITSAGVPTKVEVGEILSADRATELVIQSLKTKIEHLNIENSQLTEKVKDMQDRNDDLECENEARIHKIEALEAQFKCINKTRQKVVRKLVDRTNQQPSCSL